MAPCLVCRNHGNIDSSYLSLSLGPDGLVGSMVSKVVVVGNGDGDGDGDGDSDGLHSV